MNPMRSLFRVAFFSLALSFPGCVIPAWDLSTPDGRDAASRRLKTILNDAGYDFDEGGIVWQDIRPYPGLRTYFGFNPSASHGFVSIPAKPEEYEGVDMADPSMEESFEKLLGTFRLAPDEAVLCMVQLPPSCRYFSWQGYAPAQYDRVKGKHAPGLRHLHEGKSQLAINASTDPSFGGLAVLILTADRELDRRLRLVLRPNGLPESWINTFEIPDFVQLGLERETDVLGMTLRMSGPDDPKAFDDYKFAHTPAVVARIAPSKPDPRRVRRFGPPSFGPVGRGSGEDGLQTCVTDLVARIRAFHEAQGNEVVEVPVVQTNYRGPDRPDAFAWLGPMSSSHSCYGTSAPFLLDSGPGEFLVTIDVNHFAAGFAQYNNLVAYSVPLSIGVAHVSDVDYVNEEGSNRPAPSATQWYLNTLGIPGDSGSLTNLVGIHLWGREAESWMPQGAFHAIPYFFDPETSRGELWPAYPQGQPIVVGSRAYLDPVTKTAPAAGELVDAVVLHVRPRLR